MNKRDELSSEDRSAINFIKENLDMLSVMISSHPIDSMNNVDETTKTKKDPNDFGHVVGFPCHSDARMEVRLPKNMKKAFSKACAHNEDILNAKISLNAQIRFLILNFIRDTQSQIMEQGDVWRKTKGKLGRQLQANDLDYPLNLTGLEPRKIDLSKVVYTSSDGTRSNDAPKARSIHEELGISTGEVYGTVLKESDNGL